MQTLQFSNPELCNFFAKSENTCLATTQSETFLLTKVADRFEEPIEWVYGRNMSRSAESLSLVGYFLKNQRMFLVRQPWEKIFADCFNQDPDGETDIRIVSMSKVCLAMRSAILTRITQEVFNSQESAPLTELQLSFVQEKASKMALDDNIEDAKTFFSNPANVAEMFFLVIVKCEDTFEAVLEYLKHGENYIEDVFLQKKTDFPTLVPTIKAYMKAADEYLEQLERDPNYLTVKNLRECVREHKDKLKHNCRVSANKVSIAVSFYPADLYSATTETDLKYCLGEDDFLLWKKIAGDVPLRLENIRSVGDIDGIFWRKAA